MNSTFKQIIDFCKNKPLSIFFLCIVTISFVWHVSHRLEHFQECDSAAVYNMIYNFPTDALSYTALTFPKGNALSPEQAEKILNLPATQKTLKPIISKYGEEKITQKLTELNALAVMHYGIIHTVESLHLPHQLLGAFSVPLSSTYSAGPGLLYTLISTPNTPYEDFMSRVLFLTIFIFHVAVILLYILCRKLKISTEASIISSLLLLFSISLYSSAYHTGSTLWNFSTEILLLFLVATCYGHKNFLKILSYAVSILVFFNYLIIFLWAAILLSVLFKNLSGQVKTVKTITRAAWSLIKTQRVGILFIALCGILFFQPGQSIRGTSNIHLLGKDIYYIVLNFFSFYTHGKFWEITQFIIGGVIIILSLFALFKKQVEDPEAKKIIKTTLAWFFLIFLLLVIFKILNLVPTRHILFLIPIWFIGLGITIDWMIKKVSYGHLIGTVTVFSLCIAGFYSLTVRAADTADRTKSITLSNDLTQAGIYDCSYNLLNKNWQSDVPVRFINPNQFEPGKKYLYISQTAPFSFALEQWKQHHTLKLQIVEEKNIINPTYFLAYNPDLRRLTYSRPNSLYQTTFTVVSISKK